jgi:lysophospholipase L1-like esterase
LLVWLFWIPPVVVALLLWPELRSAVVRHGDLAARIRALPPDEKADFYAFLASHVDGGFDITGEPGAGRLLQAGRKNIRYRGADVVANRAGLRSAREFGPKPRNTFRVVCLGDSFTFGTGGREEDRYGDQLEAMLREAGATGDGKPIEVYSVGIGSWSSPNETTYMSSRLSAYAPDVIVPLMVANDLADTLGVMGTGVSTKRFTPERTFGSSVFFNNSPTWGLTRQTLLHSDIGPFSRARWEQAFRGWRRLEELQQQRGGQLLFYFDAAGMRSPFVRTSYFKSPETRLPHDSHPNRKGHRILATHFAHTLAAQGWIEVDRSRLPELDPRLTVEAPTVPSPAELAALRARLANRFLPAAYDFDALSEDGLAGILGGVLPDPRSSDPLQAQPAAGPLVVLLLERTPDAREAVFELRVPDYVELFPFELEMQIDGRPAATLSLEDRRQAGVHELRAPLREYDPASPAVEIRLHTRSYWSRIHDHTTRSYWPLRAYQK